MSLLKWFREIHKEDVNIAGGKGANLGEMYNANFPIPPGFVITADAYKEFVRVTGIEEDILKRVSGLDVEDSDALDMASEDIKDLVRDLEDSVLIKKIEYHHKIIRINQ